MASAYGAHLTAAAHAIVPEIVGPLYSDFVAGLVNNAQDEAEAAVSAARERFEQAARSARVNHSFHGFSSFVHAVTTVFAARLMRRQELNHPLMDEIGTLLAARRFSR